MGTAHDWSIEFHDASEGKTEETKHNQHQGEGHVIGGRRPADKRRTHIMDNGRAVDGK